MLVSITVNQDGFIGMWMSKPERIGNIWKSKYPFINSLCYEKIKKFVEETQMNWTSEPVAIPINI